MNLFSWLIVLLISVGAAHWGSDQIAEPLGKLRRQWGLTEAAGAAFVALATASPEIGTNTASAVRGLSDIGLGNLLGSNIISVPAIVTVAYFAAQKKPSLRLPENPQALRVKSEALTVQAVPYIMVVALAALLTIPAPWRGLQPIDGWLMLGAYVAYAAHAIILNRGEGEAVKWNRKESIFALLGVVALMFGAYFIVTATERVVSILGISNLVGGLFITSTLSIVPEIFATWSVARSGQFTAATTSVIADNTATMTLAFFPLALVTMPIENLVLYSVNLFFVGALAIVYALFIRLGLPKYSFSLKEVLALNGIYAVYLVVVLVGVLKVFS